MLVLSHKGIHRHATPAEGVKVAKNKKRMEFLHRKNQERLKRKRASKTKTKTTRTLFMGSWAAQIKSAQESKAVQAGFRRQAVETRQFEAAAADRARMGQQATDALASAAAWLNIIT